MSRFLVTGTTGGKGGPLCRRLDEAGHELVLACRNAIAMKQLIANFDISETDRFQPLSLT
jgi:uncharacterized protein YbjT (DUF2867 family)